MKRVPWLLILILLVADIGLWWPRQAEAQRVDTVVRIVGDDTLMNRLVSQLQLLNATMARSTRTLPFQRPVGQIGDALKVWPVTPADPCAGANKGNVAISQTATTRLVVGIPGQRIFVCALRLVAAAAEIPSFIEGTVASCGTGTTAVSGSTTAANGESYQANGGFSAGGGSGSIMVTNKPGNDLCLQQSGANRLAGNIVYAYGQ